MDHGVIAGIQGAPAVPPLPTAPALRVVVLQRARNTFQTPLL